MAKKAEELLQECLERIRAGEDIETCLARYPEQAAELRPLLLATLRVKETFSSLHPHPYFRARTKYRLLSLPEKRAAPIWGRRWALAILPALFVLLLGGTAMAAQGSLPDEPLYPVKRATERVQLVLTFAPADKAELQVKLAGRRISEMGEMAKMGKLLAMERSGRDLLSHLHQLQALYRGLPEGEKVKVKSLVVEKARQHRMMMRGMKRMPVPAPVPMPGWVGEKDWEEEYERAIQEILEED